MADYNGLKPGEILADASVAEFISRLGLGIAEAQRALDENSIDQLGEFLKKRDDLGNQSLLDLGLLPAFYHYQHADISCSLQLSLKVQESFGVELKLNTSIKNDTTDASSDETSETTTESGSTTSTSTRAATLTVKMSSPGTLKVGGTDFVPAGIDPAARIADLTAKLRSNDASGVTQTLAVPVTTPVNPVVDPPSDKVIASPNAVAFLTSGFDHGVIEIKSVPLVADAFTLNAATTVTPALPQSDNRAYATDLAKLIEAKGFAASATGSDEPLTSVNFAFNESEISTGEDERRLRKVAAFLKGTGRTARVVAHTDTKGSPEYNIGLGNRRVDAVFEFLTANGVAPAQLEKVPSTGEAKWKPVDDQRNPAHRLGQVFLADTTSAFVIVGGDDTHPLDAVSPDLRPDPAAPGNGFIYLSGAVKATSIATSGRKIIINGENFLLSGGAAGGNPTHSPEAYAINLASAVNASSTVKVKAWAAGNVTTLANEGDRHEVTLLTTEARELVLTGSEGVTITSQFTRTRTAKTSTAKTGNTSVAFGASLDLRYSRAFEMHVTGNSAISARLVSIPAPPEFLAAIKEFLKT